MNMKISKKFSRLLSMVLALVMTFSCVAFSSVSAMAASVTETWVYEDSATIPTVFGYSGNASTGTFGTRKGVFTENIFDNKTSGAISDKTGYDIRSATTPANYTITLTPTKTGTLKLYIARNNSSTGSYTINGSTYTAAGRDTTAIGATSISVTANETYTIVADAAGILLMGLSLTYEDSGDTPTPTTYTGTVNVTNNSATAATVTVNGVPKEVAAGATSSLEFTGLTDGETYVITVDDSHEVTSGTASLKPDGGNATTTIIIGDKSTTESSTESTTAAPATEGTTEAPIGELVAVLNPSSDLTAGEIESNTTVNGFTMIAGTVADKLNMTVDSQKVTVGDYSFTQRLKTGGTGSKTKRAISFTTTGAGNLVIYALSANSTNDRTATIVNEAGDFTKTASAPMNDGNNLPTKTVIALPAADTYYIYSSNSGVNFFLIGTDVALVSEETTSETTSETTTQATTESTTESTTFAYVAEGNYALNSEVVDKGDSEYANMKFTGITDVSTSNIRLKNTSSIKFAVAEACNLTATFSNSTLMLGDVQMETGKAYALSPNVEYTIKGGTGSNTWLSQLSFAKAEVVLGTIEGTLTMTDIDGNSDVVVGATINYVNNNDATIEGSVVTNAEGKFSTTGLKAGTYTLTVDATDVYDSVSAEVEVSNDNTTTQNLNVVEKAPTEYSVNFVITNNSSNANTLVIRSAATGDVIDDTMTLDGGTVKLTNGTYNFELLDTTKGSITTTKSFTVNGADLVVEVTVAAVTASTLTSLTAGKTYNFGTGTGNISASTSEFKVTDPYQSAADYIAFASRNNGSLQFKLDEDQTIVITAGNKASTLTSSTGTSYNVNNGTTTLELPAGEYTLNGAGGTGIRVMTIEVVGEVSSYDVTLSGTNNTGADVEVTILNAAGNNKGTFTATSGEFTSGIINLQAGTYTLTTPSGSAVTAGDEFTVSAEGTISGIVIDKDTSITVPVTVKGNDSAVSITINGTSFKFVNGATLNLTNVNEGATITFAFSDSVAKYITGWDGLNVDSYAKGTKTFTGIASTTGFTFTYNANAMTTAGNSYGTSGNDLEYGNYGYGNTKGTLAGATPAEDTAELNATSGIVTLYDYMGGYTSSDARFILNNADNVGISFTAKGNGYVIIDISYTDPVVTVDGIAITKFDSVGTSTGKRGFSVEAGQKVVIKAAADLTRSTQIKSIRYQTNGNLLVLNTPETINYDELPTDTKTIIEGTHDSSKVFAKIVGQFDVTGLDVASINNVGIMIVSADSVESAISSSNMYMPASALDGESYVFNLTEDTLYDGIYDGNDAVDGVYTQATGSEYNDNIYYMLRYVDITPGDYYVLPYTVIGGTAAFDFASASSTNEITNYRTTFTLN